MTAAISTEQTGLRSAVLRDGDWVAVKQITPETFAVDSISGLLAPMPMAPIIAIVDASIIMSTTGPKLPVQVNLKNNAMFLLRHPLRFACDPFWAKITFLCWMVYGGTYLAANNATSYLEANGISAEDGKMLKLVCSGGMNMGLTLVKDLIMVPVTAEWLARQSEGNAADGKQAAPRAKRRVPMRARAAFMTRDMLTMMAAFHFGDKFGSWIYDKMRDYWSARTTRQVGNFILPAALQPVSTVFHLYGLNTTNSPTSLSPSQMASSIWRDWSVATFARVCRIVPAVSISNNVNNSLRDYSYRAADRLHLI